MELSVVCSNSSLAPHTENHNYFAASRLPQVDYFDFLSENTLISEKSINSIQQGMLPPYVTTVFDGKKQIFLVEEGKISANDFDQLFPLISSCKLNIISTRDTFHSKIYKSSTSNLESLSSSLAEQVDRQLGRASCRLNWSKLTVQINDNHFTLSQLFTSDQYMVSYPFIHKVSDIIAIALNKIGNKYEFDDPKLKTSFDYYRGSFNTQEKRSDLKVLLNHIQLIGLIPVYRLAVSQNLGIICSFGATVGYLIASSKVSDALIEKPLQKWAEKKIKNVAATDAKKDFNRVVSAVSRLLPYSGEVLKGNFQKLCSLIDAAEGAVFATLPEQMFDLVRHRFLNRRINNADLVDMRRSLNRNTLHSSANSCSNPSFNATEVA